MHAGKVGCPGLPYLLTVVQHTLYVCDVGLLRGTATLHGSAPWQHDIYLDMAICQACRVMCSAAAPTPPLPCCLMRYPGRQCLRLLPDGWQACITTARLCAAQGDMYTLAASVTCCCARMPDLCPAVRCRPIWLRAPAASVGGRSQGHVCVLGMSHLVHVCPVTTLLAVRLYGCIVVEGDAALLKPLVNNPAHGGCWCDGIYVNSHVDFIRHNHPACAA